ncbi:reverse transcriptase domain-containing protein [Tanacetum coccineum]
MELLIIEGKTLKGRRDPLGTITEDRKASIEVVKSGQLSHLVKGIKKERVKASENQQTEGKKDKSTAPAEAPILMIRQDSHIGKLYENHFNLKVTRPLEGHAGCPHMDHAGYHHIQMAEGDEDKTTFFAGEGGIWANPSKVKAITDVGQLKTLKDVHSLNGKNSKPSEKQKQPTSRKKKFMEIMPSSPEHDYTKRFLNILSAPSSTEKHKVPLLFAKGSKRPVYQKLSIEDKEILQALTKEGRKLVGLLSICTYVSGLLPEDPKESRMIKVKAPQCKLIRGNLYRRSFYTLWFRCVASPQTDDISYGEWGVNILGPLPTAPRGFKFLAIAVEHSTKWEEEKPLTVINGRHAERFVWEYIVCRFGEPRTISSKEEKHF